MEALHYVLFFYYLLETQLYKHEALKKFITTKPVKAART